MTTPTIPSGSANPNVVGSTDATNSSSSKCAIGPALLFFRPLPTYQGEFGFDWMRDGDMDLIDLDSANSTIKKSLTFNSSHSFDNNNYKTILAGYQNGKTGTTQEFFTSNVSYPCYYETIEYENATKLIQAFYSKLGNNDTVKFTEVLIDFLKSLKKSNNEQVFTNYDIKKIIKYYQTDVLPKAYAKLEEEYNAIPIISPSDTSRLKEQDDGQTNAIPIINPSATSSPRYCKHWLAIFPKILTEVMNENLKIGEEYPKSPPEMSMDDQKTLKKKYDKEKNFIKMQHSATLRIYAKNINANANTTLPFTGLATNICNPPNKNSCGRSALEIQFQLNTEKNLSSTKTYIGDVTITSSGILEQDTEIEFFLLKNKDAQYAGSIIVCKNDFRASGWEKKITETEKTTLGQTEDPISDSIKTLISTKLAIKPAPIKGSEETQNKNYQDGSRRQDVVSVNLILKDPSDSSAMPKTFEGRLHEFGIPHSGRLGSLYKGFHQCLLYGKVLSINLDLTKDLDFNFPNSPDCKNSPDFDAQLKNQDVWLVAVHQKASGSRIYVSPQTYQSLNESEKNKYNANKTLLLLDNYPKETDPYKIPLGGSDFEIDPSKFSQYKSEELLKLLLKKLNAHVIAKQNNEIQEALDNNCVIMFNVDATLTRAVGWAYRNSNLVINSSLTVPRYSSTALHEGLHSMGISHTFIQASHEVERNFPFYFLSEKYTDNALSYNYDSNTQLTWHWQAKKIKVYSTDNDAYPK